MKKITGMLLLLLLTAALPVQALVDPVLTTQTVPGWMADIRVWSGGQYRQLCKGTLIAPQWVLSSGLCMLDPNHYLDDLYPSDDPPFWIKLGPFGDGVEVEKYYISDDYRLMLFRIAFRSSDTPLPVSTKTAAQLLGSQITIVEKEKSAAVYHGFFNPGVTAVAATCKINGTEYQLDNAFCYLQGKTTSASTLYKTTATAIDPKAATAPATALDKAATINSDGRQLYLDFRAGLSYPCLEDVGAPLLGKAENGSDELVGLVAGVGMTASLPICGMSLYNTFPSAEAIRTFIDTTYASYDFATRCPSAPSPAVSYTGGAGIALSWRAVKGATGYKVHYTTRHGQVPIAAVDVKTQTTINTALAHGTDYLVAVTAYNANCSSAPSKPLPVNVDVH